MNSNDIIQAELINLPYILKELEALGNVQKEKEVSLGLRKAGSYLISKGKQKLKSRLHKDNYHKKRQTGNLLKSFSQTVKRGNRGVIVGFRYGESGGNHAHLIDQGTSERVKANGGRTGKVIGNTFWTDTKSQDSPSAQMKIMEGIQNAVDKLKNR